MVATADATEKTSVAATNQLANLKEVLAICPGCKAIETLQFNYNDLVKTRRYTREGDHIYHDCGTDIACRLFY